MGKVRSLAHAAAIREASEVQKNALLCLVKAMPGRVAKIPHAAMQELRGGDGVEITVDTEGVTLRFMNANDPETERTPDAG